MMYVTCVEQVEFTRLVLFCVVLCFAGQGLGLILACLGGFSTGE